MDLEILLVVVNVFLIFLLVLIFRRLPKPKRKRKRLFWQKERDFTLEDYESFVYQLAHALKWMSQEKVGALIVIEKDRNLNEYIALGYQIKARVSAEFLISIFSNKNSALHDGGVIIRGFNLVSVSSYFPITQSKFISTLGARHRASAGLTEHTDAIAFTVSETTGKVSYSIKGELYEIYSGDINSMAGKIFDLLNFYMD